VFLAVWLALSFWPATSRADGPNIERDAHSAAELILAKERIQIFSNHSAIPPQEAKNRSWLIDYELRAIQRKGYRDKKASAELFDRTEQLVRQGESERQLGWVKDARIEARRIRNGETLNELIKVLVFLFGAGAIMLVVSIRQGLRRADLRDGIAALSGELQ
jgi:hypothetical protein